MKRVYPSGATKKKKKLAIEKENVPSVASHFKVSIAPNPMDETTSPFFDETDKFRKNIMNISPSRSTVKISETAATCTTSENMLIAEKSTTTNQFKDFDSSSSGSYDSLVIGIIPTFSCDDTNRLDTSDSARPSTECFSTDSALWVIDNSTRMYWIKQGPLTCQNRNGDYKNSVRIYDVIKKRVLTSVAFERKMHNGETITRDWLLYSPSKGCVFCFVCRLFSDVKCSFSESGFSDWKHSSHRISEHENGQEHRKSMLTYYSRKNDSSLGRIDKELAQQFLNEQQYWQDVLTRIVAVIMFLASRSLAFRGDNQTIGSQHNGNYLEVLELLSLFDPFLDDHIKKYGNSGTGNPSYLSANICEEFIAIMGEMVMSKIRDEILEAKYYSISCDSTPDLSHVDQLSFTIRYVRGDISIERFLSFIPIHGHGAEYLTNVVIDFLLKNKIPISDCRGQSYDNASNMAGQYSGLQTRIRTENKFAVFVPCAGHSLNLVGVQAVECCTQVVAHFDFVQKLYTFFSASTHRWEILTKSLGPKLKVLKRLSDTRWSAHADASSALCDSYGKIQAALDDLVKEETQTKSTQHEAQSLSKKMDKKETAILVVLWKEVLNRFNETSKTLQKSDMDLSIVVKLIRSLKGYVEDLRDKFDYFENLALTKTSEADYSDSDERVKKRSTRFLRFEGKGLDTVFQGNQKFRIGTYIPIIDSLVNGLTLRNKAYEEIYENFGFLQTLNENSNDELRERCENLASHYVDDLENESLLAECQQLKHYVSETEELSMMKLYSTIKKGQLESTFPNIEIALRIFLSMMVTNCSGERSFSKLKIIKNERRTTQRQSRLNYLSLMSIESDILKSLDFSHVIKEFASRKARKKNM